MTVTPYLCAHDCAAALAFYAEAFGAVETERWTDDHTGKVGHAEFHIGDSVLFISDEWAEGGVFSPKHYGGAATAFTIEVPDVHAAVDRAVNAGATIQRPIGDSVPGLLGGWLTDPFGYRWNIFQVVAPALAKPDLQERVKGAYTIT
jgi:PhnB protein